MKIKKSLLFYSVLIITACTELSTIEHYQAAVRDAAIVEAKDRSNQLWAITKSNPDLVWNNDKTKLLVVTWKSRYDYDHYLKNKVRSTDNLNQLLWVSVAPQVKFFCQNYAQQYTDEELNLRLKQYLGLAPSWQYDVFVELWVDPNDLFRPCVDPEVTDNQCNSTVPEKFPTVASIPDYSLFYQRLYVKSFRAGADVPWTGLGYSYDWGNELSKVGASEFILKPNAPYEIKQVLSTQVYCAK